MACPAPSAYLPQFRWNWVSDFSGTSRCRRGTVRGRSGSLATQFARRSTPSSISSSDRGRPDQREKDCDACAGADVRDHGCSPEGHRVGKSRRRVNVALHLPSRHLGTSVQGCRHPLRGRRNRPQLRSVCPLRAGQRSAVRHSLTQRGGSQRKRKYDVWADGLPRSTRSTRARV